MDSANDYREYDQDFIPLPPDYPGEVSVALPRPRTKRRSLFREIVDIALVVVVVYTLANLLSARFIVDGPSMQPNLETGQFVLVSRVNYLMGDPTRGDVVVFRSPDQPGYDLIKRIIGLSGETVNITDEQVFIGNVVLDEPYVKAQPRYSGTWTLGPDEYFALGDNRNNSRDSHSFGAFSRTQIIGQAAIIYWPPEDWGLIQPHRYSALPSE